MSVWLQQRRGDRGWALLDAVVGLALVCALVGVLIVANNRQRKARQRLSDERAAARVAEKAVVQMRYGLDPRAMADAWPVEITDLPKSDTPPGMRWVWVHATYGQGETALIALVPRQDDHAVGSEEAEENKP